MDLLTYLSNELKEDKQTEMILKYGFGLGSFIEIPTEWSSDKWASMRTLLDALEFNMRGLHVYSLPHRKADALRRQLNQIVPTHCASPPSQREPFKPWNHSFGSISPVPPVAESPTTCKKTPSPIVAMALPPQRRVTMDASSTLLWHTKRNRNRARRLSRAPSTLFESNRLSLLPKATMPLLEEDELRVHLPLDVALVVCNSELIEMETLSGVLRNVSRAWRNMSDRYVKPDVLVSCFIHQICKTGFVHGTQLILIKINSTLMLNLKSLLLHFPEVDFCPMVRTKKCSRCGPTSKNEWRL